MTTARPVALVTGASSGIGKATAGALTAAGFAVIGTSRDASRVAAPDGVSFLDLDVTSEASVTAAVEQVVAHAGDRRVQPDTSAGAGLEGLERPGGALYAGGPPRLPPPRSVSHSGL